MPSTRIALLPTTNQCPMIVASRPLLRAHALLLLLLAVGPASYAQQLPAAATTWPPETSAAWLARVQQLPPAAQVAALRERLQADAHRTFRNDPSQMAACFVGISASSRAAWEAVRRSAPDTVVHDDRVLCVVNGRLLSGPAAATALGHLPTRAVQQISFLAHPTAQALYGTRAAAGVVLVKTR